ncbi:hypothetical protein MN608_10064 [Microdochium nivale]|nr:hypothetical protein MN608_10064 [Microdochium nivale]
MKSQVLLALAFASTALASPAKRAKCGGGHDGNLSSYSAYATSTTSGTSYSTLSDTTSSATSSLPAVGTICTSTSTATEVVTETESSTSTPAPVTTVTTETETTTETTTLSQETSIFSSTSTVFTTDIKTDTATVESTSVVTVTETSPAPTSTVERKAAFTPIQSVYGPNGISARSEPTANARLAREAGALVMLALPDCTETTTQETTVTQTSTSTVNIEAPTPTSTNTATTTVTSTSSVLLVPASSTTTILQTDVVTSTSTVTSTQTVTSTTVSVEFTGPTPIYYAVCGGTDNTLSSYRGQPLANVGISYSLQLVRGVAEGYDCCALCEADPNCGLSLFSERVGGCHKVLPGSASCDATASRGQFLVNGSEGFKVTVYNSNCGQWSMY